MPGAAPKLAAVCATLVSPSGKPGLNFHSVVGSSQPSSNRKLSSLTPRLLGQFLAETAHHVERTLLVVSVEVAQVVPGVVMQKGAIRMSALELDVVQEVPAQLARMSHADHGGIGDALSGLQRQFARKPARGAAGADTAFGQRLLETQKPGSGGDGRSLYLPRDDSAGTTASIRPICVQRQGCAAAGW